MIRVVEENGCRVELNLANQVLRAERAVDQHPNLQPALGRLGKDFVPLAVLVVKGKRFDDGLMAATEVMAQRGCGNFGGKRRLLEMLSRTLGAYKDETDGAAIVRGAARLGGIEDNRYCPAVEKTLHQFNATQIAGKALGFYTWNSELEQIFKQDRLLQKEILCQDWKTVVKTIKDSPDLTKIYVDYINLVSALTSPLSKMSLAPFLFFDDLPKGRACFFPPSMSHEETLMHKVFEAGAGFDSDIMEETVNRLREGSLDLSPNANSGWYDYGIWSIVPLAVPEQMPEATKLQCGDKYRELLSELFKSVYALSSETHIKQLGVSLGKARAAGDAASITVSPEISIEPAPSFYLRRAFHYRFIRGLLESTMGKESLAEQHRLSEIGPIGTHLQDELGFMEMLFYGAHVVSCRELGMPAKEWPDAIASAEQCVESFTWFASHMNGDPDLGADMRMMVPVAFDAGTGRIKTWMFLGWRSASIEFDYVQPPEVVSVPNPMLNFKSLTRETFIPVFGEAQVKTLLSRDEFRRHCSQFQSAAEIIAGLQAYDTH